MNQLLNANWIWHEQEKSNLYNQTIVAVKTFSLESIKAASIQITADSYYRLFINDRWVCDGPPRSWPQYYQYDDIDITLYLRKGTNSIKIVARYFGVGTFHQIPQTAAILAQIDVISKEGSTHSIKTDNTWQTAVAKSWVTETPKISIQMEPAEYYNALYENELDFRPAKVLFDIDKGPWKNLSKRDVKMLTYNPVTFARFISASIIADESEIWCIPFRQLFRPGFVEANRNFHSPFALITFISVNKKCAINIKAFNSVGKEEIVAVDGKRKVSGIYELNPGDHTIFFIGGDSFDHSTEVSIIYKGSKNAVLFNPIEEKHENPWVLARFDDCCFFRDDINFEHIITIDNECREKFERFQNYKKKLYDKSKSAKAFKKIISEITICMPSRKMFVKDGHVRFMNCIRKSGAQVLNPEALIYDSPEISTIMPPLEGDGVELVYDLGEQRCGYYYFELLSNAGVEIDIYGVEHINAMGKIQHTIGNRNGMTYITKQGVNNFISMKRRSGRYIYISLRNIKEPIKVRKFGVIESTYPVEHKGHFVCSDSIFNKIWDISTKTLKLCMEDVFTDCPLYEQTLWVGDARNESLFAYQVFGATDIARRCIEIAAKSLERYPIVGCQVPSSWDCLIPAWSFLWGVSVWEHYWYTGDKQWLKKMWPYVLRNLRGAFENLDEKGLVKGDFWNFFDWANIDSNHNVVIYNTMLLVGAVNAAIKCGNAIEDSRHICNLSDRRGKLVNSINTCWDDSKKSYPDSLLTDGTPTESICQHTSFLAVLYDIVEDRNKNEAVKNILSPPDNMVKVGSPFTTMYLYEALENTGHLNEIIDSIRKNYTFMIEQGATTVWESFDSGIQAADGFPTRSHCHGWSSVPIYFFVRIILGIRQSKEGCTEFEISPWIEGLDYAYGETPTSSGNVKVFWRKLENKILEVNYNSCKNIKITFVKNDSMKGWKVISKRTDCHEGYPAARI